MSSWTVPHRSLQIVAFLLILVTAVAFAMGLAGTMTRGGRLPGARILSGVTGTPIEAEEATPLSNDRIQGPPKAEEDKKPAGNAADNEDEAVDERPVGNTAPVGNAAAPPVEVGPVGNAADLQIPPVDEPPH